MQQRDDFGMKATAWFESLDEDLSPLATELRALVLVAAPGATEVIKWGTPVYEKEGLSICSLRGASGYVAL